MSIQTKKQKQKPWRTPSRLNAPAAREKPAPVDVAKRLGMPRLLSRPEVCALAGLTYASIWSRMRAGTFPRSRIEGGRSVWISSEVSSWLDNLPIRRLKGDRP